VFELIIKPVSVADDPPLEFEANVNYRKELAIRIDGEESFRNQYLERASVNSVGWTYQAKPWPITLPMILYPIQRRLMRVLQEYGGQRNLHLDKTRDMGITCTVLWWMFWMWMFVPQIKFHIGSWKGKLVDQTGHMGTPFGKLDHMLSWLPPSIRPKLRRKIERQNMYMLNPMNKSIFTGEATTTKMARGDRNFCAFLDEFAHMGETPRDGYAILNGIKDTTDCLILNSTPFGIGNAFADYKTKVPITMSFWWPDHPLKGAGLKSFNVQGAGSDRYNTREGKGDEFFAKMRPPSGFWSDGVEQLRGKLTSPWYEHANAEAPSAQYVGQELDIDYAGSGWQFFSETLVRRILTEDVMPPIRAGKIVFNPESGNYAGFDENREGPLLLWVNLRNDDRATSENEWVCGVDIAAGSTDKDGLGHSNSCAVMLNQTTGEVGAELTVSGVSAHEFGFMTVAFCRMFNDAFMVFEGNGPGMFFMKVVVDYLHYGNLYYRRNLKSVEENETSEPGFWTMPTNKPYIFSAYRTALNDKFVTERCKNAAIELRMYQDAANNTVVHAIAASTIDPTGARDNHADRVVARVMAYQGMLTMGFNPLHPEDAVNKQIIYPNSVMAMRKDQVNSMKGELVY